MKPIFLTVLLIVFGGASAAHAQFGGVVFDPTQSGHAIQQILQASQIYTTTVQTTQNVIAAYNLATRMASSPASLYRPSISPNTYWTNVPSSPNVYGNTGAWTNAVNTGSGAQYAYRQSSLPRSTMLPQYRSLTPDGQQDIAAEGATADLNDAVTAGNMQTLGTIRATSEKRETDIQALESATQSMDPTQHTELATLQRINQALVLELQQRQEENQIGEALTLQQIVAQKQKQDALEAGFQDAANFSNSYETQVAPAYNGTAQALNY